MKKITIKRKNGEKIFIHECEKNSISKTVQAYIDHCNNLKIKIDLRNSDLSNIMINEYTSFITMQCPEEGSFIAFKKAQGFIVKLLVTEDAKRSSATSLKCRCSKAKVLEIQKLDGSISALKEICSNYDNSFIYKVGETVEVNYFNEDRWNKCSIGIHFFISREMAVQY